MKKKTVEYYKSKGYRKVTGIMDSDMIPEFRSIAARKEIPILLLVGQVLSEYARKHMKGEGKV